MTGPLKKERGEEWYLIGKEISFIYFVFFIHILCVNYIHQNGFLVHDPRVYDI